MSSQPGLWSRISARLSRWPLYRSLQVRVTLLFLLFGLAILAAGWLPLRARSASSDTANEQLRLLSNFAAAGVQERLMESIQLAQTLAADPLLAQPTSNRDSREVRLRYYHNLSPFLEDLTLVDVTGEVLASDQYSYGGRWADSEAFRRAVEGRPSVSDPFPQGNPATFSVLEAVPITHPSRGVWAVLAIQLPLSYFSGPIESLTIGKTGRAFLVDSRGVKVDTSGQAPPASEAAPAQASYPAEGVALGDGGSTVYAVATVPVEGRDAAWRVVLQVPVNEAYQDVKEISRLFLIVGAGVVAMVVVGAGFVATLVSRPVQRITRGTRELSRGNLDFRVHVPDRSELGELAQAFNSMATDLGKRMAELQESRRRLVIVQEGVRREIAERLHGPVQTQLLVLWHFLGESERLLAEGKLEEASTLIKRVREELQNVQEQEIRGLSHRLHPSIVRVGLSAAMRSLRDQLAKLVPVRLDLDERLVEGERENPNLLPVETRLVLYRIAEEALNNVVKHSGATEARVTVTYTPGSSLGLTVEDNGKGIAAADVAEGLGLRSIRDYAESLQGSCELGRRAGGGTRVSVMLPLDGPR